MFWEGYLFIYFPTLTALLTRVYICSTVAERLVQPKPVRVRRAAVLTQRVLLLTPRAYGLSEKKPLNATCFVAPGVAISGPSSCYHIK